MGLFLVVWTKMVGGEEVFKNNEETIAKFRSRTYKETSINRFEIVIWIIWKINAIFDPAAIGIKRLSPGFFEYFNINTTFQVILPS